MLLYVLVYASGSEIFFQLGATQAAILLLVLGRSDLIDIECFLFIFFYFTHTHCYHAASMLHLPWALTLFLLQEKELIRGGLSKKKKSLAAKFGSRCTRAYQNVAKKIFFSKIEMSNKVFIYSTVVLNL